MYDSESERLIQRSPKLKELDVSNLPDELSRAYAELVAFRTRMRTEKETISSENVNYDKLARLAATYESYVSTLRNNEDKESAAFVAATAYQLMWLYDRTANSKLPSTKLLIDSFTSDISALLLFLIAGYTGDAVEVAQRVSLDGLPTSHRVLVQAICLLARGKLQDILEISTSSVEPSEYEDQDYEGRAANALYTEIYLGIRNLASQLTGMASAESPRETFERVMKLAVEEIDFQDLSDSQGSVFDTYSGPHHLASLLLQASDSLFANSVINIPAPQGVDPTQWFVFQKDLSQRRPFLWRNHLSAIGDGYLNTGVSSAVSFPTGAGKSTISELKIASTLIAGGKVLFIVPTHALVSQVYRDLKKSFPESDIRSTALVDGEYAESEPIELPDISILTPERCLTQIGVLPIAFESVKLVIFDECHLLHPKNGPKDRRSLDAMFCTLRLFEHASKADFVFLSAMMKNTQEISGWIKSVTGRECLSLDLAWKPTRQVRGCLLYDQDRLTEMQQSIAERRRLANENALRLYSAWNTAGKQGKRPSLRPNPKAADKEDLSVSPLVLFCLKQQWAGNDMRDYALVPILESQVSLALNNNWLVTANRNNVAVEISANFAKANVKTLVFAQNRNWAASISRGVAERLPVRSDFALTEEELRWRDMARLEAGGIQHVYQPIGGHAACHHGLLLASERLLNESVFLRPDGIHVLSATPTLAQGINLPAEAVLMAGDDRFDQDAGANSQLDAHELLNAAGRAGRAGFVSNGVVLIIPGSVVGINTEEVSLSARWFDLKAVFTNPDQCLEVEDPIDVFLDLIQSSVDENLKADVDYFLTRLPIGKGSSDTDAFFNRTLAAYKSRSKNIEARFLDKVARAMIIRSSTLQKNESNSWIDKLATATGFAPVLIESLYSALTEMKDFQLSVVEWVDWFFEWLASDHTRSKMLFDAEDLKDITNASRRNAEAEYIVDPLSMLRQLVLSWIQGATLAALEAQIGVPADKLGYCELARKFINRSLREVSYALGVAVLIAREQKIIPKMPIEFAVIASCVKAGFSSAELLALSYLVNEELARSEVREKYSEIEGLVSAGDTFEEFRETKDRIRVGLRAVDLANEFLGDF